LRILLDENLDWRLAHDLPGHEVKSVPLIGWAGIENGVLLQRAEDQFDVLITTDSKMVRELEIQKSKLAIIVLRAPYQIRVIRV
jgi:predicted nuclease of predicted toxin-antitoxin system